MQLVGGESLLYSYAVTFRERQGQTDTEVRMTSNLCEEVMPQNVVQVGSVLGDLGQQAGD